MRTVVAILALLIVFPTRSAFGQSPDTDALLREGVAQRRAGDDDAALRRFARAYAISPTGNALGQMGLAEQALSRWQAAEEHLRAALGTTDPWVERNRTALEEAYGVVREHAGRGRAAIGFPPPTSGPPLSATHRDEVPAMRIAGYVGVGVAGLMFVATVIALGVRESTVQSYNARCRGLGDPTPPPGCAQDGPLATANTATTTAIVTGIAGSLLTAGAAVALLIGRHDDGSQLAFVCVPDAITPGVACRVRF